MKWAEYLDETVDFEAEDALTKYHFDVERFNELKDRLKQGHFSPDHNRVSGGVTAADGDFFAPWAQIQQDAYRERGQRALEEGRVARVILNGGMATRFGGTVKGIVPVVADQSFLALQLRATHQPYPDVPVFLLNSFATENGTLRHLNDNDYFGSPPDRVISASQNVSIRLNPDGTLAKHDGKLMLYAPGHGDIFEALGRNPEFRAFADQHPDGLVLVSNVDNLFADVNPELVGWFEHGSAVSAFEVTKRNEGDRGGAPAMWQERLQLLEGFRFPADFPMERIPVFNTNTAMFRASVMRGNQPLAWYRVDKKAHGQTVVQFERLMGEITRFVDSAFVEVPRTGAQNRFLPIKTPEDLDHVRSSIQDRFSAVLP